MNQQFMLQVEGDQYLHLGIFPNDKIVCDANCMEPSHLVVCQWDNTAHICTLVGDTDVLDEASRSPVPDGAVYIVRCICPAGSVPPLDRKEDLA